MASHTVQNKTDPDPNSINQDDIDERTQQVRLMWDIYFRARMVLVSLGDGGSDGPVAVEFMQVRPDAWYT